MFNLEEHIDKNEFNKKTLGKWITQVENKDSKAIELLDKMYYKKKGAYIIGITGAPGVGKSTLVDKLVSEFLQDNLKIAVIAVDPSSPFTGGAILGDRVRMCSLNNRKDTFIRSIASRGSLGGLSTTIKGIIDILDIGCYNYIFLETVGVGQSEVDVMKFSDTTIVVSAPGLGDDIQAIKAGVMEIADIFVVNKADRLGALKLARTIENSIYIDQQNFDIKVISTESNTGKGIYNLKKEIIRHQNYILKIQNLYLKEKKLKSELLHIIKTDLCEFIEDILEKNVKLDNQINYFVKNKISPYLFIAKIENKIKDAMEEL